MALLVAAAAAGSDGDAVAWARRPIRSAAIAKAGLGGGEGCQVVRTLASAGRSNASVLLLGADVGGVHRSLDGGATWHPAMVGWNSRGSTGFAFDPHNASHVVGIGGNSGDNAGCNGAHVSFDMASSWSFVAPVADGVACLDGEAVVMDPSSFSAAAGMSMVVFWSSQQGLWRSDDAGRTWRVINRYLSLACLAVDSAGRLFAASNDYRSFGLYTCGANYTGAGNCSRWADYTTGLSIPQAVGDPPDAVYISNWAGVLRSSDHGGNWSYLGQTGLPARGSTPIRHVAVSPADASHMSAWYAVGAGWNTTHVVSHDGGASWQTVAFDNGLAFMPYNGRDGKPVWHPSNASVHWNAGGDWPTRSDDGGLTLRWSGDGYNVVMVGTSFQFNARTPDALFVAFQDYASALTLDGGGTWAWGDISGQGWGGFDYGGVALSPSVMWAGDSTAGWGGPRSLTVSADGGRTWKRAVNATGSPLLYGGLDASYADPVDPLVGFASEWRTADGGASWRAMAGVSGVLAHDANPALPTGAPRALFGVFNPPGSATVAQVVTSADHGATWSTLVALPVSQARDVAFDWATGAVYAAASSSLVKCTPTALAPSVYQCAILDGLLPRDQNNGTRVMSVAVDPQQPSVVYVGQTKDVYAASNAVARSLDGGATWVNMLLQRPLSTDARAPLQGPHEVSWLRVHPVTRELWAAGECFGLWSAPASALALAPAPAASPAPDTRGEGALGQAAAQG